MAELTLDEVSQEELLTLDSLLRKKKDNWEEAEGKYQDLDTSDANTDTDTETSPLVVTKPTGPVSALRNIFVVNTSNKNKDVHESLVDQHVYVAENLARV